MTNRSRRDVRSIGAMLFLRAANAYIERGDPQSALALIEVWGIADRYGLTEHGSKPHPPMSETDAGRLVSILADQIDLRVKRRALIFCGDAVRFGSWPDALRPQLTAAALEAIDAPPICLLPHVGETPLDLMSLTPEDMRLTGYLLLYSLRDPDGKQLLQQAAIADPDPGCRKAAQSYLRDW